MGYAAEALLSLSLTHGHLREGFQLVLGVVFQNMLFIPVFIFDM